MAYCFNLMANNSLLATLIKKHKYFSRYQTTDFSPGKKNLRYQLAEEKERDVSDSITLKF